MGEFTPVFENGTWVTGCSTDGTAFKIGLVFDFDSIDGEHYVAVDPTSLGDLPQDGRHWWCNPDDIETADAPEWAGGGGPEHVFVVDWMDDHVPNVELFGSPEKTQAFLDELLATEAPDNLQLKLMECVADPGERIELSNSMGVRFCAVKGNER
jgi:hypothetical protein